MSLWKLLIAVSLIAWYLPVLSFRNNRRYLPYFVVNSLVDPIYIALRYTFHLGVYNYIPIALFFEAMTLPLIDAKSRTISSAALLFIAFTVGKDGYLEFIICESVLSLMVYYLLKDAISEIKNESAFKVFHLLLLIYFLRNGLMFYLYYSYQTVLIDHYILFLITIIILPVLIAYFGPEKKIFISKIIPKWLLFVKKPVFEIVHFQYFSKMARMKIEESPSDSSKSLNRENGCGLTKRENEILMLIHEGMTSQEMAHRLCLSKRTVENHRTNIRQKLGISRREELIKSPYAKK